MANTVKVTKAQKFDMLLTLSEVKSNPMLVEFIEHEKELLAKKNASSKGTGKPTAKQKENATLQSAIYHAMEPNRYYQATELFKLVPEFADLSVQRLTAQLRVMHLNGQITKTVEKRRSYFVRVEGAEGV